MKIIGITGGIGTGKSTILHLLENKYRAYIVEADSLAHTLMQPGMPVYDELVSCFGTGILAEDGSIDRGILGGLVFGDEAKLNRLNQIVHPAVKEHITRDIFDKRTKGVIKLYVIEAALLIEDGYQAICDEIWYIYTEREERIRRLMMGRGGTREKWEAVIEKQSSEEFYMKNSSYIVKNDGDFQKTADIVNDLLCQTI